MGIGRMSCRSRTGVADPFCAVLALYCGPVFLPPVGPRHLRTWVAFLRAAAAVGAAVRALASQGCRIHLEWPAISDRRAAALRQSDNATCRRDVVGAARQA